MTSSTISVLVRESFSSTSASATSSITSWKSCHRVRLECSTWPPSLVRRSMEASISSLSKLSLVEGKQLNTTWTASWEVLSLKAFYLLQKRFFMSCVMTTKILWMYCCSTTFIFFFIGRLSFKRRQEKEARTSFEGINWRLKELPICSPGTRRVHSCQSCTWQRAPASLSGGVPTGPGCLSCQHWIIFQPFHILSDLNVHLTLPTLLWSLWRL